ncbi:MULTISPECIES: MSHA biogenesis protein MshP [Vibrio]|uniref:MSHA biogenesis protein MshP n=1 Tax=Vibrio TaxID=662 RepID=UPI0020751EF4|nr:MULTISPECIES: MSHA biogenesis protein MshP [Vibrio]USD32878.1 MSHA biogenesis protein MshP [Vibrio sp. SCSIO 43186]USD45918.1 MSHA biogenesis protein MshP [Vibrio sp. SCSIO 43145]USD70003.1 MSHA biogenesis protein MshP [Vibrio sp. SCSIO 43139]USD94911.1 MSHA biogenesis protein MshP [Vibrio coralliilyticus]
MMRLSTTRRRQQGSGLLLVIFIIVVVVGFMAAIANRNQERSSDQLIAAVIGTRAEMAARSAAQIEISRFYQPVTDGSCQLGVQQTINFNGGGLSQCSATVTCSSLGRLDNNVEVFQLVSTGQCQVGTWQLQRVIEVGVRNDA